MGISLRAPRPAAWLLAIVASPAFAQPSTWTALGPAPATQGQTEGITDDPVAGAIHAIAPHPTDAAILYIGAVNGGVWKTTNATAASPTWSRLTDAQLSNGIGDLGFDPTDATHDTLVAGVARYSSFGSRGGRRIGVLRTTNGGASWTALTNNLDGRNVSGVAARGNVILASVDIADVFACANVGMFRSTDGGATFAKLPVGSGLPAGGVDALAADPSNNAVFYASLALAGACSGNVALNGIYKSTDTGATWTKVSTVAMDNLFDPLSGSGDNVRIATTAGNVVVVAIARGTLRGVFHSANGGTSWTSMSLPFTVEGATQVGAHPGNQGSLHLSLAVDPANTSIVYVGGDRQPVNGVGTFPNSSGAQDFSGRLFRGNVTLPSGSEWSLLTHSGAANVSAPHADSREMKFDAGGRLLEADDGGIYARLTPTLATGAWISLNGDLQVNEQHSAVFDPVSNVVLSGNQDTGTTRQVTPASRVWLSLHTGDGGDVETDDLFLAAQNQSIGYSSFQNLGSFRRRVQDASNVAISTTTFTPSTTSGPAFVAQFTTPVVANQVAGGRLIFGGANSVYESLNRGDSRAEVPTGVAGRGVKTAASGADNVGYGAAGNVEALYVGGCLTDQSTGAANPAFPCDAATTGVYRRLAAGGSLTRVYTTPGNSTIHGVALDADDPAHVFAVQTASTVAPIFAPIVLRSVDSGDNWTDVTGNLPASAGAIRSILYVPHATNDLVVVGTEGGVHATSRQRGFTSWTPLGTALPNVPVFDLSYDPLDDLLHAGTLGRGSFSLARVASAPVTVADSASTQRTVPVVVDVLANDTDVGGALDATTVALTSPALNGTTSIHPTTGAITYTSSGAFTGNEVIAYRVRDDLGTLSNVSLVTIRVNAAPVASADSVVTQRATAVAITVLANDSDPDGTLDAASVAIVAPPSSGSTSVAPSGVVTYTPAPAFSGTVTFTYTVRDNDATLSNVATVTVRVNAPPIAVADAVVAQRNTAVPIAVLANDSDGDGSLAVDSVAISTPPASGATIVSSAGVVTYTPASGFTGTVTFGYTVRDNDTAISSPATVTVRVNAPPVAVADSAVAQRNTALPITVLANDSDSDGTLAPASVAITAQPSSGAVSVAPSGVATYTPAADFAGTVTFAYTVQDNDGGVSAPAAVTVRVNAPPVAVADSASTFTAPVPIAVLANDSDADGTLDAATVEIVAVPSSGTTQVGNDGVVTFTPAGGSSGPVTFTYRVRDNDGAASNAATVTVTIGAPNVAPVALDDAIAVATGGTATALVGGATSLLANDTDPDADPLVLTTTPVTGPQRGTVTLAANGTFTYVHDGSAPGYDEFTYTACDGRGGCDTARVAIRIGDLLHRDGFE